MNGCATESLKARLPFLRIDRFGNELTSGAIEAETKVTIREYRCGKGFRDSLVVANVTWLGIGLKTIFSIILLSIFDHAVR